MCWGILCWKNCGEMRRVDERWGWSREGIRVMRLFWVEQVNIFPVSLSLQLWHLLELPSHISIWLPFILKMPPNTLHFYLISSIKYRWCHVLQLIKVKQPQRDITTDPVWILPFTNTINKWVKSCSSLTCSGQGDLFIDGFLNTYGTGTATTQMPLNGK